MSMHDEQLELLERLAQPLLAGDRQQRVAGDDDHRPHRLVAVEDGVGHQRAGQRAAAQAAELGVDVALLGRRRRRDRALG